MRKINITWRDRDITKKPKDTSYGLNGRSPSQQRKIDARILQFKSILFACLIDFFVIGPILWGITMSGGEPCHEKDPHVTHVKMLMTPEEWEIEKTDLISIGNNPNSDYLKQ